MTGNHSSTFQIGVTGRGQEIAEDQSSHKIFYDLRGADDPFHEFSPDFIIYIFFIYIFFYFL